MGEETKGQAFRAIVWSVLGILAYVTLRFELRFAIGAIVASVHDVLFTIGLLVVLQQTIDISVIAALLTVVGYSLNDTIVVFDRIRETLASGQGGKLAGLLNWSINQTLSRTLITALTTLFALFALLVWGGPVLRGFTLTMMIGIVIGTYSSIFIASPVLLLLDRHGSRRSKREARAA